ncbi:MAG: hypothetical protein J6Y24_03730 [Bacteroidales bacterium]|nr:hypothetical protein [Bacteroidales bacterium]
MNINKFSFSRFASFFQWYAAVNTKSIVKFSAATVFGTFLAVLILNWYAIPTDNSIYQAIFLVMSGVASSMVLSEIDKQPIRQQFLLIPASRLEKYISILFVVIIRIITILLALYLADFMRAAFQFLKFKEFTMVIHSFNNTIIPQYPSLLILFCLFNLTAGMSVRKYAFLYGSFVGLVIFLPALKFVITAIRHNVTGEGDINIYTGQEFNWPIIGVVIFSVLALVFNYFSIFKRIQKDSSFFHGDFYDYNVPLYSLRSTESEQRTFQKKFKILKKYSVKHYNY